MGWPPHGCWPAGGLREPSPLSAEQASRRKELLPLQPEGSPVDRELMNGLRDELP